MCFFALRASCFSSVGNRHVGKQRLSIGANCDRIATIEHEFLHALGFWHEQSRNDRDDYVQIMWDRITEGREPLKASGSRHGVFDLVHTCKSHYITQLLSGLLQRQRWHISLKLIYRYVTRVGRIIKPSVNCCGCCEFYICREIKFLSIFGSFYKLSTVGSHISTITNANPTCLIFVYVPFSGKDHNFNTYNDTTSSSLGVPYDYGSMMHYSKTAFSKEGEPTIVTNIPAFSDVIGQRMEFSDSDLLKLHRLYNCSKKCWIGTSKCLSHRII